MSRRKKAVLIVLSGALFLEGIDVAMLNVALPAIRAELDLSTPVLSAVVSAYVLGYAGFMLLGGRAADLFGRRRMFLLSLSAFILFSGLGGLATEGWVLILSRFATGIAAAFMTPAGLSLVTTNFPEGPQRNKAVLIYSATGSAGFSLGLVAGGLLAAIDWRWVFFAPVILATIIFFLSLRFIIDGNGRERRQSFDIPGAVTLTGAMLLATYAVMRLDQPAEGWSVTLALAAASAILGFLFVAIQRRSVAPLLRLGILRSGPLVRINLSALLFAAAFFGFQFIVSLYLQELLGWTPLQTSLALLAIGIDLFLAPTVTPWLVERFGNMRVILGGLLLAAASYALFLRLDFDWTYAAMVPSMVLLGLSFAFALARSPSRRRTAWRKASRGWRAVSSTQRSSSVRRSGFRRPARSASLVSAPAPRPRPIWRGCGWRWRSRWRRPRSPSSLSRQACGNARRTGSAWLRQFAQRSCGRVLPRLRGRGTAVRRW